MAARRQLQKKRYSAHSGQQKVGRTINKQKDIAVPRKWKGAFKAAVKKYPYLDSLTRRKRALMCEIGVSDFPEKHIRVVDISQNKARTQLVSGYMPCITPKGEKYLTDRRRPLLGVEAMRLQGMWLEPSDPRIHDMSDSLLRDLAGNAFEQSCFAAVLWCTLVFYAKMHHRRTAAGMQPRTPIYLPDPMLEKCEDDDDVRTEVLGEGRDQGNSSVVSQHKTD